MLHPKYMGHVCLAVLLSLSTAAFAERDPLSLLDWFGRSGIPAGHVFYPIARPLDPAATSEMSIRNFRSGEQKIAGGSLCEQLLMEAQVELGRVLTNDEIQANHQAILDGVNETLQPVNPDFDFVWLSGLLKGNAPIAVQKPTRNFLVTEAAEVKDLQIGTEVVSWDSVAFKAVRNRISKITYISADEGYYIEVDHAPYNIMSEPFHFVIELIGEMPAPLDTERSRRPELPWG